MFQLVEAYRSNQGQSRRRVVSSLGNATLPAGDPRHLTKAVEHQMNGQADGLDGAISTDAAAWVVHVASLAKRSKGATQSIDGVLLDEIQTEQVVELGPQLVAMKAQDALGFTPMLQNLGMNPTATAIATAQVMISNRLIESLSEWALLGWAQRATPCRNSSTCA